MFFLYLNSAKDKPYIPSPTQHACSLCGRAAVHLLSNTPTNVGVRKPPLSSYNEQLIVLLGMIWAYTFKLDSTSCVMGTVTCILQIFDDGLFMLALRQFIDAIGTVLVILKAEYSTMWKIFERACIASAIIALTVCDTMAILNQPVCSIPTWPIVKSVNFGLWF